MLVLPPLLRELSCEPEQMQAQMPTYEPVRVQTCWPPDGPLAPRSGLPDAIQEQIESSPWDWVRNDLDVAPQSSKHFLTLHCLSFRCGRLSGDGLPRVDALLSLAELKAVLRKRCCRC